MKNWGIPNTITAIKRPITAGMDIPGKQCVPVYGDMDIAIPMDRKGEYEPQLIPKYQNTVTQDMEEKIISMYAKGMTTGDIEAHLKELYDLDISDSTISRITDKIMPLVKEWADRAENQNLVSALSITINKILCQFFKFTQNLKRSHIVSP